MDLTRHNAPLALRYHYVATDAYYQDQRFAHTRLPDFAQLAATVPPTPPVSPSPSMATSNCSAGWRRRRSAGSVWISCWPSPLSPVPSSRREALKATELGSARRPPHPSLSPVKRREDRRIKEEKKIYGSHIFSFSLICGPHDFFYFFILLSMMPRQRNHRSILPLDRNWMVLYSLGAKINSM